MYPKKYSGKISFDDYLKQFKVIAQINGWIDDDQHIYLLSMVHGRPQVFANDLLDRIRISLPDLCDALLQQFGAHKLVESYRHELLNCSQAKDEKFRDLGIRLHRMVSQAFPTKYFEGRESLAVYHFDKCFKRSIYKDS